MRSATAPAAQAGTPWAACVAGALLGGLIGLALFAPAHWLTRALERISADRVQWQHVGGTIWSGSGQPTVRLGPTDASLGTLPGAVHWTIRPQWDGLALAVYADCCTTQALQFSLHMGWDGMRLVLADGVSRWPAQLLDGLGAPWNTLRAQGSLALRSQQLQLHMAQGRWRLGGSAQLEAIDISTRLSPLKPLGSYRLRVVGGETPSLDITTLAGSLQIEGQGQWTAQGLRVQAQAQAAPGYEDRLGNLLNIIGQRQGARATLRLE